MENTDSFSVEFFDAYLPEKFRFYDAKLKKIAFQRH